MKSYFSNLPMRTWLLLVTPVIIIAYPIVWIALPAIARTVVPEVVRSVLNVL